MTKPVPINLVPHAALIEGAREFLRVWTKEGGPVTCFINPVPLGADPFALGVGLVDVVRHGARAYARAIGVSEGEAEARIWAGLDAERAHPTDQRRDAEPAGDDGLITYTKPETLN